jgi:5-methylcytosine-specific restriction protein A
MRYLLFKRDKGICVLCQTDTVVLKAEYDALPKVSGFADDSGNARSQFLELHGIPHGRAWSDWWDADHITPVIEGGGECGLDNFRTLCIPCHRKVTKELHSRLKQKRVEAKSLPLFDNPERPETSVQGEKETTSIL